MEPSAVLAGAEDQVIDEAVAVLAQRDQARQPPGPDGRRRDLRQLFHLVLRCMRAGRAEPIIGPAERIATHCYAAGVDLAEVAEALNVLAEVLWRQLTGALAGEQLIQALGLLNAIAATGKDATARIYLALAIRDRDGHEEQSPGDSSAAGAGCESRAGDVVLTSVVGQVGIITLDDRPRRNAIGVQMAAAVIAGLESLRARQVRAIVLRAAAGMHIWSAGHDIDQPIAAQVFERVQGLREEAFDSSDYLEGLNAFAEKRQPIFRGT